MELEGVHRLLLLPLFQIQNENGEKIESKTVLKIHPSRDILRCKSGQSLRGKSGPGVDEVGTGD